MGHGILLFVGRTTSSRVCWQVLLLGLRVFQKLPQVRLLLLLRCCRRCCLRSTWRDNLVLPDHPAFKVPGTHT
jgi:hypothetical protein